MRDLHDHIEHESNEDMPRLEKILSRDESVALARSFERTKIITPTRSHPSAPNKPIDKVADPLRSFPEENKL